MITEIHLDSHHDRGPKTAGDLSVHGILTGVWAATCDEGHSHVGSKPAAMLRRNEVR